MRGVEQIPWFYDAYMSLVERAGLARWRAWLMSGTRGKTLEVGCGTGRNLALHDGKGDLVALDPDRQALGAARRRAGHVPLVVGDAEHLPFRDHAFDTVVSGLVFCSVPDAGRGLEEVRRVLRSGGQFRMMEHVRSTSRMGAALQDIMQPVWTWVAGGCHPNRDTEAAVEDAGFRIDRATRRARGNMRRFVAYPEVDERGARSRPDPGRGSP